jgi:putative tricarboxylic transport membrane protein
MPVSVTCHDSPASPIAQSRLPADASSLTAIWLHGIKPGPMLALDSPDFLYLTAITLNYCNPTMLVVALHWSKPKSRS